MEEQGFKTYFEVNICFKGKDPTTKLDEFLEKFQMAFDPPLIFGKLCCNFFIMDMVAYMQVRGPDSMKSMHMISRDRDHSEGWEWGSTAVLDLSENSSDLVA